ncbi:FAD-dependent oxidoreductase [Thiomicrorhabdus indica]|uniref:FAD-dependent oxidoreductase n=1 Tax=Thiomicrorhabdus indica TaxID=2267253 RepID=UPI002AA7A265|nr:FAD-dependent oxidoreductase [Thiomicrorhabdus indica]
MHAISENVEPRIAILGAGLLGRLMAYHLKDHAKVFLYDKDQGDAKQSAAYLAAAMLAPLAESAESSIGVMRLGEYCLERWKEILADLPESVFFQQNGSLLLAFEQDRSSLQNMQNNLKARNFQKVDSQGIANLEPEINQRFQVGLFLPDEGQLDNRHLLKVLAKVLQNSKSVNWQTGVDAQIDGSNVSINGLKNSFDWILDCRGLGSKPDQADLRGVRGEVIRLRAPDVNLHRPVRLMHPRYPIYIAPKPNHEFVVGATQLESEDQRKATVRSTLELLSACFSVHSGFAEAEILSNESGLRPAYLDNEPQMRVSGNVISLNGLYRHGYLLSPLLVDMCVAHILDEMINPYFCEQMPHILKIDSGNMEVLA